MTELKTEFKSFMDDIEKNIKNEEDLQYIKSRVTDLFSVVLEEMQRTLNYKEEKMNLLMQNQQEIEEKMNQMQQVVNNIEKDIYADDGFDFEIICPYCNYDFIIDFDENRTEVQCPECDNIIELDWSGDLDEEESGCSGCSGCQDKKEKLEEDNEDDM